MGCYRSRGTIVNESTKEYLQVSALVFGIVGVATVICMGYMWLDYLWRDGGPIRTPLDLCILAVVVWLFGLVLSFIKGRKKK